MWITKEYQPAGMDHVRKANRQLMEGSVEAPEGMRQRE